jgi:mRNA interferase YafQ
MRGKHGRTLSTDLKQVLPLLVVDAPLPTHYRDHLLTNWNGCRECHIHPDLLLIYAKPDTETLRLERLGSHAELFG